MDTRYPRQTARSFDPPDASFLLYRVTDNGPHENAHAASLYDYGTRVERTFGRGRKRRNVERDRERGIGTGKEERTKREDKGKRKKERNGEREGWRTRGAFETSNHRSEQTGRAAGNARLSR